MRRSVVTGVMLGVLLLCASTGCASEQATRPNVVVLLVDDMGWRDIEPYGQDYYETPHIAALAEQSVRFTSAYASGAVCSPTRAALLTGRHPVRVNITDWIPGMRERSIKDHRLNQPRDRDELALEEVTLAEVMKQAGYQTWFVGKWHLGGDGFGPEQQGFDVNIGGQHKGSPGYAGGYFAGEDGAWATMPGMDEAGKYPAGAHLTEELTHEALALIKNRDADKPFLLYFSYYNVHTPLHRVPETIDYYERKLPQYLAAQPERKVRADYASMVGSVDASVGRVMGMLKDAGLDENTIVVFTSDNGGLRWATDNRPLRSGKGWLYEGGIRVPLLVRAPGVSGDEDTVVVSTDVMPTLLELTGVGKRESLHADGESFASRLRNEPLTIRRASVCWHYPHYHGQGWAPGAAIRAGDWKLIAFYHDDRVELYNLKTDPNEKRDLSKTQPRKAAELLAQLRQWQAEMGAAMPTPRDQDGAYRVLRGTE